MKRTDTVKPTDGQPPAAPPPRIKRPAPKQKEVKPKIADRAELAEAAPERQISSLGSLEAELMSMLWEIGQPASGMDVMEASLHKRRSAGQEPISFPTIATTLRRLAEKGLLKAERTTQRTPLYTPTVGREQMAARVLNNVSVTLLGQSMRDLLPRLTGIVQQKPQSPQEEEAIARLIQALNNVAGEER